MCSVGTFRVNSRSFYRCCLIGWHLPVRSRPFSRGCFFVFGWHLPVSSRPFPRGCFVCSFGTFQSEAVRFLGVVLCVRLAPSCQQPSVFSGLFCVFGWHLPVRSRPFFRGCVVCSVGTYHSAAARFLGVVLSSRPFSRVCFVCSVGTLHSEAVRFLGVVLCVRLAPSCQKPSVFSGLFCVFGWHLPVNSRSFSRVCFVCSVGAFLSEADFEVRAGFDILPLLCL